MVFLGCIFARHRERDREFSSLRHTRRRRRRREIEEEGGGLKAILHFSYPQLGFLVISWHFKVCIAHFQFHLEAIMTLKHAIMS